MKHFQAPRRPGFAELFEEYSQRQSQLSSKQIEGRRREVASAQGINQLSGAGEPSVVDKQMTELWITGRVSEEEYTDLCLTKIQEQEDQSLPQPRL